MLKNIPDIISPELMKMLMEMGHGDELVLGDANFPAVEMGKRVVFAKGLGIPVLLEAILLFLPLDKHSVKPVAVMQPGPQYDGIPEVWEAYKDVINTSDEKDQFSDYEYVDRFDFYDRTKKAFAVVATSETALYANVILKKGFV